MSVLLSTAYWPGLPYLKAVLEADSVTIEQHEHYGKQTYRNRCSILSANGGLRLSIPIKKVSGVKQAVKTVEICYRENWQHQHWKALISAYKNSPYFEFFEDDFKVFYTQPYSHLLDFNTAQLRLILKLLRVQKNIVYSESYVPADLVTADIKDLRALCDSDTAQILPSAPPYHQTFSEKMAFVAGLSCLDALFNMGLGAKEYVLR